MNEEIVIKISNEKELNYIFNHFNIIDLDKFSYKAPIWMYFKNNRYYGYSVISYYPKPPIFDNKNSLIIDFKGFIRNEKLKRINNK